MKSIIVDILDGLEELQRFMKVNTVERNRSDIKASFVRVNFVDGYRIFYNIKKCLGLL